MARVGRPPSCTCDACPKCERRRTERERYRRLSRDERRAVLAARDPTAVQRYAETPEGRAARASARRRWAKQNPEKVKAKDAVSYALRSGRLVKGACEVENDSCVGRIEGHHDDYSKPLDVRWLCKHHHEAAHHG